jgi:hypothetical protein
MEEPVLGSIQSSSLTIHEASRVEVVWLGRFSENKLSFIGLI